MYLDANIIIVFQSSIYHLIKKIRFINTSHPDFIKVTTAIDSVLNEDMDDQKMLDD